MEDRNLNPPNSEFPDAPEQDTQCEVCGEMNFKSNVLDTHLGEDDCEMLICIDCYNAWMDHSGTKFATFLDSWQTQKAKETAKKITDNFFKTVKIITDTHETKKIISQMSPEEIRLDSAKRFCERLQIKEGTKEYNDIMERNVNSNTKSI